MAVMPDKFRIEPDPHMPGRWQFVDCERRQIVSGFRSAKDARRAYERERKQVST